MKKGLFIAVALATSSIGFSQLSTRESAVSNYSIGTRPEAGDLSLTFGVPLTEDNGFEPINLLRQGDLLTGKYYKTDDLVFRAGFKLTKSDNVLSGKGDDDFDPSGALGQTVEKSTEKEREFSLRLGAEKHFSNSNIFDVYAGGDLHLGFGKELTKTNNEFKNGDFNTKKTVNNNAKIGLTPFIGVQMFVLDLPISVGVEYGIDALWNLGSAVQKVKSESSVGGTTTDEEYFERADGSGGQYSKLKIRTTEINTNQNVKLVVNIYFGGKSKAQAQ